jgi:hypothetical protein
MQTAKNNGFVVIGSASLRLALSSLFTLADHTNFCNDCTSANNGAATDF